MCSKENKQERRRALESLSLSLLSINRRTTSTQRQVRKEEVSKQVTNTSSSFSPSRLLQSDCAKGYSSLLFGAYGVASFGSVDDIRRSSPKDHRENIQHENDSFECITRVRWSDLMSERDERETLVAGWVYCVECCRKDHPSNDDEQGDRQIDRQTSRPSTSR